METGQPFTHCSSPDAVYADLRAAAQRHMASERAGHTLGVTGLVHEAYLRLAGERRVPLAERAQFYSAAVEAMRRVLLDHARARRRDKRGGGRTPVSLDAALDIADVEKGADYEALDAALVKLAQHDARMARVVELRFLAGFGVEEVAKLLDVSERTVKSDWSFARAWLAREVARAEGEADD